MAIRFVFFSCLCGVAPALNITRDNLQEQILDPIADGRMAILMFYQKMSQAVRDIMPAYGALDEYFSKSPNMVFWKVDCDDNDIFCRDMEGSAGTPNFRYFTAESVAEHGQKGGRVPTVGKIEHVMDFAMKELGAEKEGCNVVGGWGCNPDEKYILEKYPVRKYKIDYNFLANKLLKEYAAMNEKLEKEVLKQAVKKEMKKKMTEMLDDVDRVRDMREKVSKAKEALALKKEAKDPCNPITEKDCSSEQIGVIHEFGKDLGKIQSEVASIDKTLGGDEVLKKDVRIAAEARKKTLKKIAQAHAEL